MERDTGELLGMVTTARGIAHVFGSLGFGV